MRSFPTRLVAVLLLASALAGCTQPAPPSASDGQPDAAACPSGDSSGFLAIAVQEGGLDPHPEVFSVETSGLATGIVLTRGQPQGADVGIPERALNNISQDEVIRVLHAADVPDEGRWNVSLAWQGSANATELDALCEALAGPATSLDRSYPDEDCRDGTTLTLSMWTPEGLVVSSAHCEGGAGTPFEEVQGAFRNATTTARERSQAPG